MRLQGHVKVNCKSYSIKVKQKNIKFHDLLAFITQDIIARSWEYCLSLLNVFFSLHTVSLYLEPLILFFCFL